MRRSLSGEKKPQASVSDDGGIIAALATALSNHKTVIHFSHSSEDGDMMNGS